MAMTLRLTDEQSARYAEEARREGVSVQKWITTYCDAAVAAAEHRRRVDAASKIAAEDWAELERRLA